jgi:ribosomal protein RSM22 (predicted rRNA methylase)
MEAEMASLAVKDIAPEDYQALVIEAKNNNRSIAAEVRHWIAELARRQRAKQLVADLKELRESTTWSLPAGMTSLELLREERDSL